MEGEAGAEWLDALFLPVPGQHSLPQDCRPGCGAYATVPSLALHIPEKTEILHGTGSFLNVSDYSEMASEETKNFIAKI